MSLACCSLMTVGLLVAAAPPARERPKPLPADVVAAWQKAGAEVGWLRTDRLQCALTFRGGKEGKPGEVPAFKLQGLKEGALKKLPKPRLDFGLVIWDKEGEVNDARLEQIDGMKHLVMLGLVMTKVTDAGLQLLAGLKSLRALDLLGARVTGAGLKKLNGLGSLRYLSMRDTALSNDGLKELARLETLRELNLSFCSDLTAAGLQRLGKLRGLRELDLSNSAVTDEGLKGLPWLASLRALDLHACESVTDEGLKGGIL